MGFLTNLFDFITSLDGSSYIEDAKEWGDEVCVVYRVKFKHNGVYRGIQFASRG